MIDSSTSLVDIAFIVCTALENNGVTAVLTGGGAAAFYAPNKYQSLDLDFLIEFQRDDSRGAEILTELGYTQIGGIYSHKENHLTLEFPKGPLGVGDDLGLAWVTEKRNEQLLHIIDRTDSVRDRLCAFYFWNDRQSLEVALNVARSGQIDLGRIAAWSERERELPKYREFEARLKLPSTT